MRLAALGQVGSDEHLRRGQAGGVEASGGELGAAGCDDGVRSGEQLGGAGQRVAAGGRVAALDAVDLLRRVELRRHAREHAVRGHAVTLACDEVGIETALDGPLAPDALDLRPGVDEHAVEVGEDVHQRAPSIAGTLGPTASVPIRRPATVTKASPMQRVDSASGSDVASARKPMNGGPARKPIEPIELTAAMFGPDSPSACPAALKASGTPLATPMPTRKKPARASAGVPASSMAPSTMPASALPPWKSVAAPSRRLSQSPNTRPAVMPPEKNANASAAIEVLVPRSRVR